jgi:glutamate synthase (NADPH) small chain
VAETSGLLNRRTGDSRTEGSNPSVSVERLLDDYERLVLAGGAEQPRDLDVPGRELAGVHFAMDYLTQANRRVSGLPELGEPILAGDKHVVVIGGGDTGSDCIGTAHRQGATSVTQLEILPEPPINDDKGLTWPHWPMKLRTSSSQEEGAQREFEMITRGLKGEDDQVAAILCERNGEQFELRADLVLLAMGFTGVKRDGVAKRAQIALSARETVETPAPYRTTNERIFACGDMRRGQSLVVWAIREGRECAAEISRLLASGGDMNQVSDTDRCS